MPCFSANSLLLVLELPRHVQQPELHALRRHDLVQERQVVAEHDDRSTGPCTFASGPSFCSKKIAAIGVTYSCEKRSPSARTRCRPAAPRARRTLLSPRRSPSVRAKIFSAIVIGRRAARRARARRRAAPRSVGARRGRHLLRGILRRRCSAPGASARPQPRILRIALPSLAPLARRSAGAGRDRTLPCSRATLYSNSPPYSMISLRDRVHALRELLELDLLAPPDPVDQREVGRRQDRRGSGSSRCRSARCSRR